jgi:hypothetical protein
MYSTILTIHYLIYYLHVRNVSHPLGPLHLKAIVIAYFTTVQCLIYCLHVRNDSHLLGPLHLKAIVIT